MSEPHHKEIDWVHRLILPCAEVTRILSDTPTRPLSRRKRIALRVHLVLCAWCARYKRQLAVLRRVLRRHPSAGEMPGVAGLSPAARDRIRQAIHDRES